MNAIEHALRLVGAMTRGILWSLLLGFLLSVPYVIDWGATFTDTVERNFSGSRLRALTLVRKFTNVGDLIGDGPTFLDVATQDWIPPDSTITEQTSCPTRPIRYPEQE